MSKDHDGIELWYLLYCPECYHTKYVTSLDFNIYCKYCESLMVYWKELALEQWRKEKVGM